MEHYYTLAIRYLQQNMRRTSTELSEDLRMGAE